MSEKRLILIGIGGLILTAIVYTKLPLHSEDYFGNTAVCISPGQLRPAIATSRYDDPEAYSVYSAVIGTVSPNWKWGKWLIRSETLPFSQEGSSRSDLTPAMKNYMEVNAQPQLLENKFSFPFLYKLLTAEELSKIFPRESTERFSERWIELSAVGFNADKPKPWFTWNIGALNRAAAEMGGCMSSRRLFTDGESQEDPNAGSLEQSQLTVRLGEACQCEYNIRKLTLVSFPAYSSQPIPTSPDSRGQSVMAQRPSVSPTVAVNLLHDLLRPLNAGGDQLVRSGASLRGSEQVFGGVHVQTGQDRGHDADDPFVPPVTQVHAPPRVRREAHSVDAPLGLSGAWQS